MKTKRKKKLKQTLNLVPPVSFEYEEYREKFNKLKKESKFWQTVNLLTYGFLVIILVLNRNYSSASVFLLAAFASNKIRSLEL